MTPAMSGSRLPVQRMLLRHPAEAVLLQGVLKAPVLRCRGKLPATHRCARSTCRRHSDIALPLLTICWQFQGLM